MSLHALRRWISRHPFAWVLGLALAIGGAQAAAAAHEYTHTASTGAGHVDAHDGVGHDCSLCLLAAALGGAAPAPAAAVLVAPRLPTDVRQPAMRAFAPRTALAYASRGPPGAGSSAA